MSFDSQIRQRNLCCQNVKTAVLVCAWSVILSASALRDRAAQRARLSPLPASARCTSEWSEPKQHETEHEINEVVNI